MLNLYSDVLVLVCVVVFDFANVTDIVRLPLIFPNPTYLFRICADKKITHNLKHFCYDNEINNAD